MLGTCLRFWKSRPKWLDCTACCRTVVLILSMEISALFVSVASVVEEPQTDSHLNFDMTSNAKRCRSVQSCQYGRIHHPVTRGKTHHRKRVLVCTYIHTYIRYGLGPVFPSQLCGLRRVVAGIVIVEPGCFGLQNQVGGAGLGDTTNTPISIA